MSSVTNLSGNCDRQTDYSTNQQTDERGVVTYRDVTIPKTSQNIEQKTLQNLLNELRLNEFSLSAVIRWGAKIGLGKLSAP